MVFIYNYLIERLPSSDTNNLFSIRIKLNSREKNPASTRSGEPFVWDHNIMTNVCLLVLKLAEKHKINTHPFYETIMTRLLEETGRTEF